MRDFFFYLLCLSPHPSQPSSFAVSVWSSVPLAQSQALDVPTSIIVILGVVPIQTLSQWVLNSVLGHEASSLIFGSQIPQLFIKLKPRWQIFSNFFQLFMIWRNPHPLASKNEPGSGHCLIWSIFNSPYSAYAELLTQTACFQTWRTRGPCYLKFFFLLMFRHLSTFKTKHNFCFSIKTFYP